MTWRFRPNSSDRTRLQIKPKRDFESNVKDLYLDKDYCDGDPNTGLVWYSDPHLVDTHQSPRQTATWYQEASFLFLNSKVFKAIQSLFSVTRILQVISLCEKRGRMLKTPLFNPRTYISRSSNIDLTEGP